MFASALVALGLSCTVWYISAQQNCGTQHLQDELPTLDRSLDAIDEEVPATMLLQSQLHMSSLMQERTAPTSSQSKLLILIVSCHQHAAHWSYLTKWGEEVHPGGKVLIMAGRLPNQTLPWPYEEKLFHFDTAKQHLVVNASDSYDGLPERMLASFHSILQLPEFADITHVLKMDDTTILGTYEKSKPIGMNATQAEFGLSKRPGDYFAPEFGYRAYDCDNIHGKAMQWHFPKMVNTSYWYNREQPCHGIFVYGDGEFGYILSRHALNVLVQAWPVDSMDDLYHRYVYEDLMIGQTLQNHSITLFPIDLQGMPHWARLRCPCNIAAPTAACDDLCANSDRRCCLSACRDHPGLCEAAIDA